MSISSYRSLFHFVFVSAISTFLMVFGGHGLGYQTAFICIGVFIKLWVFPLMSWLYNILEFSTWDVGWFLSGFLKFFSILLTYYGLSGCLSMSGVISLLCLGSFVVLSYNIWVYSDSWVRFWCHVVPRRVCSFDPSFYWLNSVSSLEALISCCSAFFVLFILWESLAMCHRVLSVWGDASLSLHLKVVLFSYHEGFASDTVTFYLKKASAYRGWAFFSWDWFSHS